MHPAFRGTDTESPYPPRHRISSESEGIGAPYTEDHLEFSERMLFTRKRCMSESWINFPRNQDHDIMVAAAWRLKQRRSR